uniref:Zinc transporter ZIP10 n=1 Tax=Phallusia mammillata TaxID=59560 RepID=A0A6F9DS35_9ASCI|nr:zinc transporter ZIP10 [Phallusia mammillata]
MLCTAVSTQTTMEGVTGKLPQPYLELTTGGAIAETTGTNEIAPNADAPFVTKCANGKCTVQFISTEKAVERMMAFTEDLFSQYKNGSVITQEGLEKFMLKIGFWKKSEDPHAGHDHASDKEGHEGHNHELSWLDLLGFDMDEEDEAYIIMSAECLKSVEDVFEEFSYGENNTLTIADFWLLFPRLLFNLNAPECQPQPKPDYPTEPKKENRAQVWGIAIASVAAITLLSIIGILIIPLMKHSVYFNRLLSFLVALAVGTLVGDGLLHLLPHAMGDGDHSGHDHSNADVVAKEQQKVFKSLVAVFGIYIFFVFESVMALWRKQKQGKQSEKNPIASPSDLTVVSPVKSSDVYFPCSQDVKESLLSSKDEKAFVPSAPEDDPDIHGSQDSGCSSSGACNHNHRVISSWKENQNGGTKTPPFPVKLNLEDKKNSDVESVTDEKPVIPSIKIESPHHGHHGHHGHSHHNPEIANASGIKDMAWMIVMGDGLHNFSDGLAIGAAFSSSIASGLSTSLAIFCHELPHELGDFAVLLNAGMSIKQALLYNAMSACFAFVGVIIGMTIGESVRLWILAMTAGGFLYVAMVNMLPQMLESILQKDGLLRFAYQNVGFLLGVSFMLMIALYEGEFHAVFAGMSGSDPHAGHGH